MYSLSWDTRRTLGLPQRAPRIPRRRRYDRGNATRRPIPRRDYLRSEANFCPNCGADVSWPDDPTGDIGYLQQSAECDACGTKWTVFYIVHDYNIDELHNDDLENSEGEDV